MNRNHKILGIKFEQAGFPDINWKAFRHTSSEAFDHIDQYIITREQAGMKILASMMDLIKASINIVTSSLNLLSLGNSNIPMLNIAALDKKNNQDLDQNQLVTSVLEIFWTFVAIISLGSFRPLGVESQTSTSFREHIQDIKFKGVKLGSEIKKFAKTFNNSQIKEAVSHNRVGDIISALETNQNLMTHEQQTRFTTLANNYELWLKEKNHSKETSHLRSGSERFFDITGKLEQLSYQAKNVGDSLTRRDLEFTETAKPRQRSQERNNIALKNSSFEEAIKDHDQESFRSKTNKNVSELHR